MKVFQRVLTGAALCVAAASALAASFDLMSESDSGFAVARVYVAEVPLPASLGLLGLGLLVLGATRVRP